MSHVVDLTALPPVVVVPGISAWLGYPPADEEPDEYAAFLARLAEAAA